MVGLLCQGLPTKAIAAEFGIAERTVKWHLSHIYRKLGVTSRVEAALAWRGKDGLAPNNGGNLQEGSIGGQT